MSLLYDSTPTFTKYIYLGKNQRESNLITCRIIHQANVISEKTCYRAVGRSENLKGQIVIQCLRPFGEGAGSFCFYFCQNLEGQLSPLPRFRRPCAKDVLQRFVCLSLEPSPRIAVSREKSAKVNEEFHFKHFSTCSSSFYDCKIGQQNYNYDISFKSCVFPTTLSVHECDILRLGFRETV